MKNYRGVYEALAASLAKSYPTISLDGPSCITSRGGNWKSSSVEEQMLEIGKHVSNNWRPRRGERESLEAIKPSIANL
jgi:hypothetical protein